MGLTKEKIKMFEDFEKWVRFSAKCEESFQELEGIPTPLPSCKLTRNACRYENCPLRKKEEEKDR